MSHYFKWKLSYYHFFRYWPPTKRLHFVRNISKRKWTNVRFISYSKCFNYRNCHWTSDVYFFIIIIIFFFFAFLLGQTESKLNYRLVYLQTGPKSLERSPAVGDFYGSGIEIWAGFGPVQQLLRPVFSCFHEQKTF